MRTLVTTSKIDSATTTKELLLEGIKSYSWVHAMAKDTARISPCKQEVLGNTVELGDTRKFLWIEARSAHQDAINISLAHDFHDIGRFHRTADISIPRECVLNKMNI